MARDKPYMINSQFLQNWEGKKGQKGEQNMNVLMCDMFWMEFFCIFPAD